MADERPYPYEDNHGRTHWEGCFAAPDHHNCAVRKVYELQDELVLVARTKSPIRLGPTSAALADALSAMERRAEAAEADWQAIDLRFRKFERAVRHRENRNHDHSPECEGCVEYAAFFSIPGYQGSDEPLVDGH